MDREQLLAAIAGQEQLRGVVPDEVVDAAIDALRSRLGEDAEPERRRRQVSVLFADVSGFTAMSESLDPEIVAELMNSLWARLDMVVVHHGGRVDKHIGDALMAVWGAEATAEDDAERTVRAALALQFELEQFRISSGRDVAIRVGVNTGPVLAGVVGSIHEFTVMGDAVNTASRLEHAAPRNGVLISHDTYRQVRGVFDVQAQEPLTVKGKTEPLEVYVVKEAKTRAFRLRSRGLDGIETSTVGREAELVALRGAFEQVVATGRCQAVVVVGDAGVGKSRLLYEFDNWLELHELSVFYFKARAIRSRTATRFGLWRDLLAFRAEVTEGDSPTSVLEKLRGETSPALDSREAMILGLWLGFEVSDLDMAPGLVSGENMATAGRAHLMAYLRVLMSESPVVMLFEDLHWADDESLHLLRDVLETFSQEQLLAVCATRPEQGGDESAGAFLTTGCDVISLGPLSDSAARTLVLEILKRADDIPATLVDLVVGRADGNPFYIEELIKKLMDDSVIDTGNGEDNWTIKAHLIDETSIPTTLTGVLEARLDTLPSAGRRTLQRASIVGRTFWDQAIEALESGTSDLGPAVSSELVFGRKSSTFPGCSEFTFKHALLHDVVYNTVLLRERPTLHERTAEWLTTVAGARREEYLEEIANHLLLAGLNIEASDTIFEAASRALKAGDPASARRLSDAAFNTRDATPSSPNTHIVLARACRLLGDFGVARFEADLAIQLAQESGDDAAAVSGIQEAFRISELQGAHDRGESLVRRGLPIAERLGGRVLTRMLVTSAWNDLNAGDLESAGQSAAASLERANEDGDPKTLIEACTINAVIAGAAGRHQVSLDHGRHIFEMATQSGDLAELALCHLNAGVTWHKLGDSGGGDPDYDRAEDEYDASLTLTRRLGLRVHEVRALGNLAQLRMRRAKLEDAQRLAEACLTVAHAIDAHTDALFAILVHAETGYEATRSVDALRRIGMVRGQPTLGRLSTEVEDIIDRIRHSHPEAPIDQALEDGLSLTFDEVVSAIIEH